MRWKRQINGPVQAPIVHDFENEIIYLSGKIEKLTLESSLTNLVSKWIFEMVKSEL